MKKQPESKEYIVRSGTRIRESIRCLPKGHFQQIRQMFDKQKSNRRNQTTNIDDLIEESEEFSTKSVSPSKSNDIDIHSYKTSIIENFNPYPHLSMATAVNYTDSYGPSSSSSSKSNELYVSNLERKLNVNAKPVVVKTTYNVLKHNSPRIFDSNKDLFQSSTSLSSTGYDSNSSPSIVSKRNSLITNNSQDFSSSSDERYRTNAWMLYESGLNTPNTIANSYSSDNISDSPPLISRSAIKFKSPSSTLERRPVSVIRHSPSENSPSISSQLSTLSSKYVVQTTSFSDNQRKISLRKKSPLQSERLSVYSPIVVQKQLSKDEDDSLPILENPLFQSTPPQKPPRTFEHKNHHDQKVPSSSSSPASSSNSSPKLTLGSRSVSCMDLSLDITNVLLTDGLLPLENHTSFIPKEHIYEELKSPILIDDDDDHYVYKNPKCQTISNDIRLQRKSPLKKVISEPNLATKTKFFSPKSLFDRFKRILPLSLSKQSLNTDDSLSTSSENTDFIRISKLDHVNRIQNIYDTLNKENLPTQSTHSITLYDYVIHILSEDNLGYFANGNGCLITSNINLISKNSIKFKYPFDANVELTLKYFCFPDQHDTNNNENFILKKSKPDFFRFILTDMYGQRQYGYCSRFIHKGILNALCLVSQCDMIDLYEKILSTATELFLSYKYDDAKLFLKEIYPHKLPNRGETIHIHTTTVGFYTLKCEYDRRKILIDSNTLLLLSTDTIIKIFSSILYEQKLIFICNELGRLTRLIETFLSLLYPFSWPHTYIPILPNLMLDIIQAPTPYIIGILRSSEQYLYNNDDLLSQDNSDIIIIDIDYDRIRTINDYISNQSLQNPPKSFQYQILPKTFKIKIKQEISLLKKHQFNYSNDECQEYLQNLFMSIFVESCYNYRDYFDNNFNIINFIHSKNEKQLEFFLEWFTYTQIFQLFIREKFYLNNDKQFSIQFDLACEKYRRTINKQLSQRVTVKSVKRKAAIKANHRL